MSEQIMDSFGIALSGMQAAQTQINIAANNIANINSPGFKAQRANTVSAPSGGVEVTGTSNISTDDLATQMTNLQQAKFTYDANAEVVKVQSQMYGSLLDIFDHPRHNENTP
jgi:flagellar hook protein FlgE